MDSLFGYEPMSTAWQWGLGGGLILCVVLVGRLIGGLALRLLARAARTTAVTWDDDLLDRFAGPLRAGSVLLLGAGVLPWLELGPRGRIAVTHGLLAAGVVVVFWTLLRGIDLGQHVLGERPWARGNAGSRSVLSIVARSAKAILVVLAALTILAVLGVPITSLIAGFGLGGLAVALAAQKTIENLFGTYSIGLDQPFREGDFVRVDDLVGTIEAIGLRSTRLRTLDRTTVLIPNAQLADARTESFSARDRIRLSCTVGVVYQTSAVQLQCILSAMEALLRAHPLIWPDAVVVRFKELAAYSLDIEVMAWFQTQDWSEFQTIRQDILLGFMQIVERNGSSFAYPSQTMFLEPTHRAASTTPS